MKRRADDSFTLKVDTSEVKERRIYKVKRPQAPPKTLPPPMNIEIPALPHDHLKINLADALPKLSMDVVGIVAQYSREPRLLRCLGTQDVCVSAAEKIVVDNNGIIYTAEEGGDLFRYDSNGTNRTKMEFGDHVIDMMFNAFTNQVLILTLAVHEFDRHVIVLNSDGVEVSNISAPMRYPDALAIDAVGNVYGQENVKGGKSIYHPVLSSPSTPVEPMIHDDENKLRIHDGLWIRQYRHFLQLLDSNNQVISSLNVDADCMSLPGYHYGCGNSVCIHPIDKTIYVSTGGTSLVQVYTI